MTHIPLIDELREIRRALSEQQGNDAVRYAAMLEEVARDLLGAYVTEPVWSGSSDATPEPAET